MTGRELICYILENHLEDEPVFKDGTFIGFMSEDKFAATGDVGIATVRASVQLGLLNGIEINGKTYLPIFSKCNHKN